VVAGEPLEAQATGKATFTLSVMENTPDDTGQFPPDDTPVERVLERLDTLELKLNEKFEQLREARDPDRLLTREEAAERLQVSVRTLDTLRAAGEIRAVKVKRRVRFHPDALQAYIRRAAEGAER
jgi:excisionase family DNA binding protein